MQEPLTLDLLKGAAMKFAVNLSLREIPELFGVDNGKTVGTYVESAFNAHIARYYVHRPGNAAKGIDFPDLNVDLKVTSLRQPQSSCPFRDALQKVYGLGYHLLILVYEKSDNPVTKTAKLDIGHVVFVNEERTADFQLTRGLIRIVGQVGPTDAEKVDDIDAYLEDRNLPLDPESRRQLATRILSVPPKEGFITISNALQWRLQYTHAIRVAQQGTQQGVEDLRGKQ